jgi:chromosome segregation ATPase
MSETRGNGHDPMTKRMVELLESIDRRLEKVEGGVEKTNQRLDAFGREVHEDLDRLRAEVHGVNERLDQTNERLDALGKREEKIADRVEGLPLEFQEINQKHAALEKRVAKVEAALLKPRASRRPRARP